jgi:hypothetical protein
MGHRGHARKERPRRFPKHEESNMKLLRSSSRGDRRAADIRADLTKVDVATLVAKVTKIEGDRRQLLLSGTDAQLEENGRELAAARLQVERAETLIDELTKLASEAEAKEAAEALEVEHAQAIAAKASLDKALADAETVGAQLKARIDEATAAARALASWNQRIGPPAAGQPDRRIPHTAPELAKQRLMGMLR